MPETPGLMALRVARAEPAAAGIQLFELRHPDGAALPPFTAGAHLNIRVPSGAMRSYSLCNDPRETDRYVIAVKRDGAGRGGSVALVDGVAAGDTVQVSVPENGFPLDPRAGEYLFIAGGIGITPIMAMIHAVRGQKPFRVIHLSRDVASTAFAAELAAMPEATLHHDGGDPDQAFDLWPLLETPSRAAVYCCGPRGLMDAVRDMTGHWPEGSIHFEDFGSEQARPRADDRPFAIQLADGTQLTVPVGQSILDVLRAHGRAVASSCESGSCGTCRTRYLAGAVDHRDLLLSPAERTHTLMPCVSRAAGDETLVLAL